MRLTGSIKAVLFDLDGTLVDSAPDLLSALDHVLARLGRPPCSRPALRHFASRGALGLLEAGLPDVGDTERQRLRQPFLDFYARHLWRESRPFEGIDDLLEALGRAGIPIGVVTNKITRFAAPVLNHAGWTERIACLVTGDRVARPKPDPEPVRLACRLLLVDPADVVFIGDDQRDVEAGQAAGVTTIVAGWGYLDPAVDPDSWGADAFAASPSGLAALLANRAGPNR
ncbi:MAG: HAD-IA family hydrolase [Pseudomonadota bacterium]|nr:MAG: HAD-IA family hydrolase [Pseudomonadota bacterium]